MSRYLGDEPLQVFLAHVGRLLSHHLLRLLHGAAHVTAATLELLQQVHQGVALLQSANRGSSGQCSEGPTMPRRHAGRLTVFDSGLSNV